MTSSFTLKSYSFSNSSLVNNTISVTKNYVGDDLKDYTSSLIAKQSIEENITPGYTKSLTEILHDNCSKGIYLNTGFLTNNEGNLDYYKFNINKDVEYSPYGYEFTNFGISRYGDDIVLYAWKDENYYAISLTKYNKFNNSIVYTKSGVGYFTLPEFKEKYSKNKIFYTAGKYIVCKSTLTGVSNKEVLRLFNIETKDWVNLSFKNFVIDELDPHNRIIELPDSLYFKDINIVKKKQQKIETI